MNIVPSVPTDNGLRVELQDRHRWVFLLREAADLSHAIANTSFVPKAMRGDEAAIAAAILYGDEVGLPPMAALSKIAVIDGRPSLAAEAQRALILSAGHQIWVEDATVTRVTVAGRRLGNDHVQRVTWTIDDAKRAGLAGKQNWRQYPRQMLLARASAELARSLFADTIGGLAATEELEDPDLAGATVDTPAADPAPAKTRRRRPAPVIAPTPPTAEEPAAPPLPDETDEPLASDAQRRKMFALFRDLGMSGEELRKAWIGEQLGREIETTSRLTTTEVSGLINTLEHELANTSDEAQ